MNTAFKRLGNRRSGFSLIEVLIAVLVLAIGMLGLGAVFPAIIAEQRDAFAVVEGANAAAAAEALISNKELVDFSFVDETFNKAEADPDYRYEYLWAVPDFASSPYTFNTQLPGYNFNSGLWTYDDFMSVLPPNDQYVAQIPLGARLYPMPYSGKDPRYVWDIAMRREPGGDRLQAAIFVRRVDARIRVPRGFSLSDVLTGGGGIGVEQTRLPVGIFNDGGSTQRSGTIAVDEGPSDMVFYAIVQSLKVEVHPEHLDWLYFPDGRDDSVDTSVGFATKVGQKLVDNTGVVRTVVEIPRVDPNDPLADLFSSGRVVAVDPPFSPSNAGGDDTGNVAPGVNAQNRQFDDERASWVRQVIFTPRTPVEVRVVTLEDNS